MTIFDSDADPVRPLLQGVAEVTSGGAARNQATDLLKRYDDILAATATSAPALMLLRVAAADEYLAEAQRILDGGLE